MSRCEGTVLRLFRHPLAAVIAHIPATTRQFRVRHLRQGGRRSAVAGVQGVEQSGVPLGQGFPLQPGRALRCHLVRSLGQFLLLGGRGLVQHLRRDEHTTAEAAAADDDSAHRGVGPGVLGAAVLVLLLVAAGLAVQPGADPGGGFRVDRCRVIGNGTVGVRHLLDQFGQFTQFLGAAGVPNGFDERLRLLRRERRGLGLLPGVEGELLFMVPAAAGAAVTLEIVQGALIRFPARQQGGRSGFDQFEQFLGSLVLVGIVATVGIVAVRAEHLGVGPGQGPRQRVETRDGVPIPIAKPAHAPGEPKAIGKRGIASVGLRDHFAELLRVHVVQVHTLLHLSVQVLRTNAHLAGFAGKVLLLGDPRRGQFADLRGQFRLSAAGAQPQALLDLVQVLDGHEGEGIRQTDQFFPVRLDARLFDEGVRFLYRGRLGFRRHLRGLRLARLRRLSPGCRSVPSGLLRCPGQFAFLCRRGLGHGFRRDELARGVVLARNVDAFGSRSVAGFVEQGQHALRVDHLIATGGIILVRQGQWSARGLGLDDGTNGLLRGLGAVRSVLVVDIGQGAIRGGFQPMGNRLRFADRSGGWSPVRAGLPPGQGVEDGRQGGLVHFLLGDRGHGHSCRRLRYPNR